MVPTQRFRLPHVAATLLTTVALAGVAVAQGDGACGDFPGPAPYVIADASDLAAIATCPGGTFVQTDDVDLSGVDWSPIGGPATPFTGAYDGQDHTIRNLAIGNASYAALFAVAGDGATVSNLSLLDVTVGVDATPVAAALVGTTPNDTVVSITNVTIDGAVADGPSIRGSNFVGGVVGIADGRVVLSGVDVRLDLEAHQSTDGALNGAGGLVGRAGDGLTARNVTHVGDVTSAGLNVGGLVGRIDGAGDLTNARHTGDVTGHGFVGGLLGNPGAPLHLRDVEAHGAVAGTGTDNVGGLIGIMFDGPLDVDGATVTGSVGGDLLRVGGVIGTLQGSASLASVAVETTSISGTNRVGGLVGYVAQDLILDDVRVDGDVAGHDYVAGFAGQIGGDAAWRRVTYTGDVTATAAAGGFTAYVLGTFSATDVTRTGDLTTDVRFVGGWVGMAGEFGATDRTTTVRRGVHRGDVTAVDGGVGGLFGTVFGDLDVEDLQIHATSVSATDNAVGGLAGTVNGSTALRDVAATTTVRSNGATVGGLVGSGVGAVTLHDVTLTADVGGSALTAGVIGTASGPADVRRLAADVSVVGANNVGGLVGYAVQGLVTDDVHVRGSVRGIEGVGGIVGLSNGENANASTLARSRFTGTVEAHRDGGGLSGQSRGTLAVRRASASVDVEGSGATSSRLGGLVGNALGGTTLIDTYASGAVSGTDLVGGLVGRTSNGTSLDVSTSYAAVDVAGASDVGALVGSVGGPWSGDAVVWQRGRGTSAAAGSGGPLAGTEGRTAAGLRDVAAFAAAGWSIAPDWAADDGPDAVPWGACPAVGTGAPFLRSAYDADPCTGAVARLDVAAAPAHLRHVPFAVSVTATDAAGRPTPLPNGTVVTLTAEGGATPGHLRTPGAAGADDPAPTRTLDGAATAVPFDAVLYTGLSADAGRDVRLRATATTPDGDTLEGAAAPISVRDVALDLAVARPTLLADGVDVSDVVVTLTDADGVPVEGVVMTVSTTAGTFLDDRGRDVGATVARPTDADGAVRTRLRAPSEAGVADLVARCPGACPVRTTVTFVGDVADVLAVPGDGVAWLLASPLAVADAELLVRQDDGPWSAFPTPSALGEGGPLRIDGLENGVTYRFAVRGRTPSGTDLPASDPVTVTPGPVAPPALAMAAPEVGAVDVEPTDGGLRLTIPLRIRNDGDAPLPHVWWRLSVPEGFRAHALGANEGRLTRYGDAWLWRDANLAPDTETTLEIVLVTGSTPGSTPTAP